MATELEGFDEFERDTRAIEKNLPDALREASMQIATDLINAASARANTAYAQQASQAFSISDDGQGAVLTNDSPVFFGSEFGGQARPETMQFPPHNGRTGYWFYPAKRDNDEAFIAIWDKGVQNAMTPWNRHG